LRKFWNWIRDEITGDRALYLSGPIAEETWWGNEATPAAFKADLLEDAGPVTVWINSPGGDVFAAATIYSMLKEYPGRVTVKIDALAASAASVVAMAGDEVLMSPLAFIVIHNPETIAAGDTEIMRRAQRQLDEVKEAIINAYEAKTGIRRAQLGHMMNAESWIPAHKAVDLGFADGLLYADSIGPEKIGDSMMFSPAAITNSMLEKIKSQIPPKTGTPIESLYKRLNLLSH